ncbi:MAG: hypothetical protein GC157_10865 [Frankiales bacterium]|nr:hypothetical protein [Frankiales bacterium]
MATEDVAALQARIAELEAAQSGGRRRVDGRGVTAWVLLVIAALLFPLALSAFWAQRTLVDTERYVATVAPLSEDPTIRLAVGDVITNALVKQLDAQTRVSDLLSDTPRLQPLAGPIAIGVNNFIATQVQNILASDQFSSLWVALNRATQQALVAALSSDPSGPVTIQGDQVVLDTGDLIEAVKQRLVDRGLTFAANVPVPSAADRQIVLLTSPQLRTARSIYAVAQPISAWLVYVVAVMFVVAVLVSRRRARMVLAVGVALLLGALVVRLGMAIGQNQLDLTLAGTPFAVAQQAFYTILTAYLLTAVRAAFALAVVLVVLGWLFSGTSAARSTRALATRGIGGAGEQVGATALGRAGVPIARTRKFWWLAIGVVATVVLLASDQITGSLVLWTTVVALLALVLVEVLAAAGTAHLAAVAAGEAGDSPADGDVAVDVTHA